jgi:RimJ/RimL family protein N-acetyltransferase
VRPRHHDARAPLRGSDQVEGSVGRLGSASLTFRGVVPELRTPRLLLRAWRPEDREPFAAMNADADVMRHIADGRPLDRAASDALLARLVDHWDRHGFGLWAAEVRATGAPAGFVGLAIPSFLPSVLPAVEVGWRLSREHWGHGYATEGARAAVDHGLGTLGLAQVLAIIDPANARSIRVAGRLGMRPMGRRRRADLGSELLVFTTAPAAQRAGKRPG